MDVAQTNPTGLLMNWEERKVKVKRETQGST